MSKQKIKYLPIKEFREKGYLQELNRRFLHPLGLALEIKIDDDGTEKLGGIWDYRYDSEGIHYALNDPDYFDEERNKRFREKAEFVDSELERRSHSRKDLLGSVIEAIPKEK